VLKTEHIVRKKPMPHILAYGAIGAFLVLGLGLFVYNMFLARQGWSAMKLAEKQKAASDAEFAEMTALVDRSKALREQIREVVGDQYALTIEPIDMLIAHSASAFTEGDRKNGMDLLNEACYEMACLLKPESI
jgi:cell division protein FtsB